MSAILRIENLRKHALNARPPMGGIEYDYLEAKGWALGKYRSSSHTARRGYAKKYLLSEALPIIDEDELIVGKYSGRNLTAEEQKEFELLRDYGNTARERYDGQASHMAVDYERLLKKGIKGILTDIEGYISVLDISVPENLAKREFYTGCCFALEGLKAYAENYALYASKLSEKEENPIRKNELEEIAVVLQNVPYNPAGSFREALQSVHFLTFSMVGLYQWGRPDRYLIEYYRNDLKNGVITPEQAQELIDCVGILFNEYIPGGLAVGLMVGGRDEKGIDIVNELTYMFIESIRHVKMIYPGVGLCVDKDTPKELLKLSCEILVQGHSHPALFNDEVITKGLCYYGLPTEEACRYIHSTCVEITPCDSSAVWVASPYTNLLQLLLDTLNIDNNDSSPIEFEDITALKRAYRNRLANHIKNNVIDQNTAQMQRFFGGGDPLVSCFVHDCLEKGADIDMGGARYNWIMPSFVGLANLCDAFEVLDSCLYKQKKLTVSELAKVLRNNYKDNEEIRQMFLNNVPKYGNDIDEVDSAISEVSLWIREETAKYTTYRGGKFVPSLFCWVMHDIFGQNTMATPDGRLCGFPLGDGSGPAQGREKKGPTASILSSTKWEHYPFIGGIAVNMKFGKSIFDKYNIEKLMNIVDVFMQRNGFELQINVIDGEKLKKAMETPELYQDIVVRVGGYSDFFVRLSKTMQKEVVERTEHEL